MAVWPWPAGGRRVTAPALIVRLPGVVEQDRERLDRDRCKWLGCKQFDRPATTPERVWLAGRYAAMPARLLTRVEILPDGVRRRSWPALSEQFVRAHQSEMSDLNPFGSDTA